MTLSRQFIKAAEARAKSLGMTSAGVCRAAGISKGAWSEFTRGKRDNLTTETMEKIADALSLRITISEIDLP